MEISQEEKGKKGGRGSLFSNHGEKEKKKRRMLTLPWRLSKIGD